MHSLFYRSLVLSWLWLAGCETAWHQRASLRQGIFSCRPRSRKGYRLLGVFFQLV